VYLDNEVALKVNLEVSNIVQEVRSLNGTLTYQLGTRNTSTVLRVANGETQVLAGLISDTDRRTADKVPGLSDMPLLGRLFTNNNDNRIKTEIVLLITPYVVRNVERPGPAALEFASGTDGNLAAAPLRLRSGEASIQSSPATNVAVAATASNVQALDVETDVAPSASRPSLPEPVPLESEQTPPRTNVAAASTLLLSAPLQVQAGREFTVAISVPPSASRNLELGVSYDSTLLEALDADDPAEGYLDVLVAGATTLRFRALEGGSGTATVSIVNIAPVEVDEDVSGLIAPAPAQINVTQ
jgi:general secretion pathway protein D